jgi:hypothetical protein
MTGPCPHDAQLHGNDMTTQKAASTKARAPVERGRHARILADGFTVEVTNAERAVPDASEKLAQPPSPKS